MLSHYRREILTSAELDCQQRLPCHFGWLVQTHYGENSGGHVWQAWVVSELAKLLSSSMKAKWHWETVGKERETHTGKDSQNHYIGHFFEREGDNIQHTTNRHPNSHTHWGIHLCTRSKYQQQLCYLATTGFGTKTLPVRAGLLCAHFRPALFPCSPITDINFSLLWCYTVERPPPPSLNEGLQNCLQIHM